MKLYEMIFEVTETCNNGNERRKKVSVFSPIFRNGKHIIELDRMHKAVSALQKKGYYKIEYIKTKTTDLIFTSDIAI